LANGTALPCHHASNKSKDTRTKRQCHVCRCIKQEKKRLMRKKCDKSDICVTVFREISQTEEFCDVKFVEVLHNAHKPIGKNKSH
jgi:hypothetical protein